MVKSKGCSQLPVLPCLPRNHVSSKEDIHTQTQTDEQRRVNGFPLPLKNLLLFGIRVSFAR